MSAYDGSSGTHTLTGEAGSEAVTLHFEASQPSAGYAYGVTTDGADGAILALDKIATVQDVTARAAKDAVKAGDSFTIGLAFDKAVTVSGTVPVLYLSDGGIATWSQDLSTATKLVFVATVSGGESAAGVRIVGVDNAGSIQDDAHVAADLGNALSHAALGPTIDTSAPVLSITSAGGLTNQPAQTVAGTGQAGLTVVVYDGTSELGRTGAESTGHWSLDVRLASNADHVRLAASRACRARASRECRTRFHPRVSRIHDAQGAEEVETQAPAIGVDQIEITRLSLEMLISEAGHRGRR